MNRGQLRERLRSAYLDDTAQPYLWEDDLLDSFLEEAQQEAVIRSRSLVETLQLPLVKGQGNYTLADAVLDVTRFRVPGAGSLGRTSMEELDESGNWEQRQGRSTHYSFTSTQCSGDGVLIVYPAPGSDGAATLTVQRLPAALVDDNSEPELPAHQHLFLLDWAAHRAFSLRDSDAEDQARAAQHEGAFAAIFGERLDAKAMRKRAEKRPRQTKINTAWR
ncbi:DUF6682 family protein [Pseudomonas aeruginosa]|nr:hypothetical protein [Pseudomonas aeruginosa]HCF5789858.1 hypothetical protein [Pseudomonas aeruginosa]